MRKNAGFTFVEVVAVMAILVIVGGVGYMAYNNFVKPKDQTTAQAQTTDIKPVVVKSKADLDAADKQLDALPVDDNSETSQLDSAANSF